VQMAAGMKGKGLLIANDISSDRVKALVKNIELCGITNAIVTNESPDRLAKNFAHFSTGYLWMLLFRRRNVQKRRGCRKELGKFKCDKCCAMQREILESADVMLKPGDIWSTPHVLFLLRKTRNDFRIFKQA